MLLHYYGIKTSEGEMAYLARTSLLGGTDHYALADALAAKLQSSASFQLANSPATAHAHMWTARVRQTDYDSCARAETTFVAHMVIPLVGNHALFVRRVTPDHADIIDPALAPPNASPAGSSSPGGMEGD